MNFWERVQELIDMHNCERKRLCQQVGFNYSNIGKGIKKNSYPSADTAVKIAKILKVSVEYLVTGKERIQRDTDEEKQVLKKLHEYRELVKDLENFKPDFRKTVINTIKTLSKTSSFSIIPAQDSLEPE